MNLMKFFQDFVLRSARILLIGCQHLSVPIAQEGDCAKSAWDGRHANIQEQGPLFVFKLNCNDFQLRSLVFIFATTAWTSFSLLPYRIFNICRIHLIDWHNINCDQRALINWLAWILLYLLTMNPVDFGGI